MRRWTWLLLKMARKLWFRAALFSLLAAVTALVAAVIAPFIPYHISATIGAEAVDNILGILASSMLTVTTFSLTTMVSAYGAATSNVTPRATTLLIEDDTAQNALSTFLGTFLYSIVGIIALSTGVYGENGRVVLFVVTIGVIAWIAITLLRWIGHLASFGQVGETTRRVEREAMRALAEWIATPNMGGRAGGGTPPGASPVYPPATGYVEHVDMNALSAAARESGGHVHLAVLPGAFVHPREAIAWLTGAADDDCRRAAQRAFTIGPNRTFGHDPRFGLIVLTEIASRALSPGINDPGTAINVLGAGTRVLVAWAEALPLVTPDRPQHPDVYVPSLATDDLFDDAFRPIARDGAAMVEVGVRLQKALAVLACYPAAEVRSAALRHSRDALARAEAALDLDGDKTVLADLARRVEAQARQDAATD
ncbi:DUF2254 domain-containing protein [Marinivivus vitaminiproducens]|uniref:DUF2254 domain-containing protein n=1 Tax=Marinivivus vitaminiproducens TaxID=3035935 RepID=UPI00279BCE69|nr:DUF2254 domain-containing protein [Geminicoccaceae bacterium SCSIO 64248]